MNVLQFQFKTVAEQLDQLVNNLVAAILALPDNPRITRVSNNCFVLCSKDLGNNWTPTHHDFKKQYQLIVDTIRRSHAIDAMDTLQRIINEGKIKDGTNKVNLHPDVIEHLKTLLR